MNTTAHTLTAAAGALGLAAAALTDTGTLEAAEPRKRPNFLLILADDMGYSDTTVPMHPGQPDSCRPYFNTPHIARLAREGVRFSNGYAPAPVCTPTRRSIQFGMTPARQRGTSFESDFDPAPHQSIAQMLKAVDPAYRCAHYGKWGEVIVGQYRNPWSELPGHPQSLAYDRSDGITGNLTGWYYHPAYAPDDAHRNYECEAWENPKLTFSVTEKAVAFLERQAEAERPFYLQVSYYAVHTAMQARQKTIEKYEARGEPPPHTHFGIGPMLDDMDEAVGTLLDTLDRLGLADDTYVFFSSDNGGYGKRSPDGSFSYRNTPLRLVKGTLYEGGIRVPFIVRGPDIAPGTFCNVPVALYDLWPTLRELAGDTSPRPDTIDGGSLAEVLRQGDAGTVDRRDPFLVFSYPRNGKGQAALRQGDYKLVVNWGGNRAELYNLADDIGESNDLADTMPEKTQELFDVMIRYFDRVNADGPRALSAPAAAE
ncbi:MAG: sulfatase [Lentisphaerae bacterium]|nr:sulfatase [Lentisphaerota bacterium]